MYSEIDKLDDENLGEIGRKIDEEIQITFGRYTDLKNGKKIAPFKSQFDSDDIPPQLYGEQDIFQDSQFQNDNMNYPPSQPSPKKEEKEIAEIPSPVPVIESKPKAETGNTFDFFGDNEEPQKKVEQKQPNNDLDIFPASNEPKSNPNPTVFGKSCIITW